MTDEPKPWTIRGVELEIQNAFIQAAEREGETLGAWFNRVGRQLVLSDMRRTREPAAPEKPVILPSDTSDAAPATPLTDLASVARQIAETPGAPAPLQRLAYAVLRDRLKAERRNGVRPMSDKNTDSVRQTL
jgi:hypothetical protein